ncbi:ABC transporter substrate-binding protein [Jatrophihabitans sp.]|uniref:ABC transporter substrate-binding protein n=1 Tax=Jatrophihabitans sp. TaxID=1932789 RepID=UPI0030C67A00|nr:Substrate-binding region of ABC-type glycine betaine transport system [Jatrophihabitans sp.]
MNRTIAIAAVLAASIGLAACSSSGGGSKGSSTSSTPTGSSSSTAGAGSITVGGADFTESTILADIYADALSAKGVKVTKKLNIGERAVYVPALESGEIGFFPEYSGSILDFLDTTATAKTPADVLAALKTAGAAKGLVPLNYAPAQDSDTITVTQALATKDSLKTIGDLAPYASKLAFGAPAGFKTRADGIPALKSVYGVTFGTFTTLSASGSTTQNALKNGTVDAADIFSTDGSIAADHFVSLTDDKNMFAAQNIVPIVKKSVLTPTIESVSNAVSAKLDTATLAKLDAEATAGQDPDSVAKEWLTSEGLI